MQVEVQKQKEKLNIVATLGDGDPIGGDAACEAISQAVREHLRKIKRTYMECNTTTFSVQIYKGHTDERDVIHLNVALKEESSSGQSFSLNEEGAHYSVIIRLAGVHPPPHFFSMVSDGISDN